MKTILWKCFDFKFRSVIVRYLIAVSAPILLLQLIKLADPILGQTIPSLIFFPGIILSAWLGGYREGIITTLISALIMHYSFFLPYNLYSVVELSIVRIVLFVAEGIAISIFIDIGKRKNKILEYRQKEKEMKKIILHLTEKNMSLEKEVKSRDEFLSIASHELKTPLTSMLLQTQHAIHNIKNVSLAHFSIESLLKMLESVENQTRRLSKMINDLLNISLITTGNLQLELTQEDLNILVAAVVDEFLTRTPSKKKSIILTCKEASLEGLFDGIRIQQAVSNLVSNAIKYGNGNPIEITVRKKWEKAYIIIKDSGIGISKEQQKEIFGLFKRGVPSEKYRGLGVGLYIANQIVHAHHGKISIASKVDKGSIFTIQLPLK